MSVPNSVLELVERFHCNREDYRSGGYKEAQIRKEFIDPFFKALGWDMDNEQGWAETYKEVIHEDSIKIGNNPEAPDYCFRIGGARKFFLEAKKPSVDIKNDTHPAYQLRRYAWSSKLPLSILTDFEEFAIYDCRIKPASTDGASIARIKYFTYDQYPVIWDEIASVFSKDAVLKGSFDRYAETTRGKKGTAEVDAAFLDEIESWRDELARNIALRNPSLKRRDLNFAVQRTIDRIIFLRICEDRSIEEYQTLQSLQNGTGVYPRLCHLFQRADQRYNSGLFHFHPEKGEAEPPDKLSLSLHIDDKPLKAILKRLYYPESPYEFSVLPADILGQVYEQFLGKVIRLTEGHRAVVEDKPEVKKAGGVFYTPTYIVEYIVKNTVGSLLEGKTPDEASRLRILDPACGSGSFLIGAYQFLLDWHLQYYLEHDPARWAAGRKPRLVQVSHLDWRLATDERKRILLNNIYGVDIDTQAVEVTKLSLLLKVLEGETQQSLDVRFKLFQERALPDLAKNIKCGNSLIGSDFYDGVQLSLGFMDEEERYRINVFDWEREFPEIFKAGGFDAVIGNPPYIRIQALKEWAPKEVEFYKRKYISASKGNYDIYLVFVEKGLGLLTKTGKLGFILPHKFFNAQYGEPLRGIITGGKHLSHIVHFGDQQVFSGATTYTCLLFLEKTGVPQCRFVKVENLEAWRIEEKGTEGTIPASSITGTEWNFSVGVGEKVVRRVSAIKTELGDIADIFVGLQTSADDVFILDYVSESRDCICLKSKVLGGELNFERELLHPLVSGTDVSRYRSLTERQFILFPYEVINEKAELIPFKQIHEHYPKTADYLLKNRTKLEGREKGKMKGSKWYGYIYLKNMTKQSIQKVCVPRLVDELCAAYDVDGVHFLDNVDVGGLTLKPGHDEQGLPYILALLNSKLIRWFFPHVSAPFRGGYFSANRQFLSKIPIRTIDFTSPSDVAHHDRMVSLVTAILDLHKQLSAARTADEKTALQRLIDATDREIDRLVYELYGLTEEEIRIVGRGE